MRKVFLLFVTVLTAVLFLSSCVSFPKNPETSAKNVVYWDEESPKEQCVGLYFYYGFTAVTSYNDIAVDWEPRTLVYLPPGEVHLLFNGKYEGPRGGVQGRGWYFKWSFSAGDIRSLFVYEKDGNPGVYIINAEDETKWENQPFYPLPRREGPTVLE